MNIVVLLAGGKDIRISGSNIAKQHFIVAEHQVIEYTLMVFSHCEDVDLILVVSNANYVERVEKLKKKFTKMRYVIPSEDTRIASVKNAVHFLSSKIDDEDKIVISDAVRPCITTRDIKEMFVSFDTYIASTSGLECYETILKLENDEISQIIKREGLIRQTSPEGYKFRAHRWLYIKAYADIINLYKNIGIYQLFANGVDIGIVYLNHLNFKITTNDDLNLFGTVVKNGFSSFLDGKNGAQK